MPDEAALRDKLGVAFVRNPRLKERWEGGTQGLRDDTRSGRDMSVLAMLVTAGFTKGETRAALCLFEHGKVARRTAALLRADVVSGTVPPEPATAVMPNAGRAQRPDAGDAHQHHPAWNGVLRFNLLTEKATKYARRSRQQDGAKGPPRAAARSAGHPDSDDVFPGQRLPQGEQAPCLGCARRRRPSIGLPSGARLSERAAVGRHSSASASCSSDTSTPELPDENRQQERDRHVAYLEHISTGFMVGAVARVMQPGCKQDHVPVVVGRAEVAQEHRHPRAMP